MNVDPDRFALCPDPASQRPDAFAAVVPGSDIEAALERRLASMADSIIGSLRRQYRRPYPQEEGIAAWLIDKLRREGPDDARAAGLLPSCCSPEESRAAELKWHLHLNADPVPLRRLHELYTGAVSAVVDFDRLSLDPEGAEAGLRAEIVAGRVAGLEGFTAAADAGMLAARRWQRRHEIDRVIEGVELRADADPIAVLLALGLRVAWRAAGERPLPDRR